MILLSDKHSLCSELIAGVKRQCCEGILIIMSTAIAQLADTVFVV